MTKFSIVSFENRIAAGHVYIVPSSIAAVVEDAHSRVDILLNNGVVYCVEGDIKYVVGSIREITDGVPSAPSPKG